MGGEEDSANSKLNGSQGVEEPGVPGIPDEKESRYDKDTQDVAPDENAFSVVAIREHTRDGADQERGEHPDDKQGSDGESRSGKLSEEGGGCNEVEPVAQQADDLAEPEIAPIRMISNQLPVTDWFFF